MTHVLTALGNRWDSRVATLLEGSREVTIVRRCADLPDLVATAARASADRSAELTREFSAE